MSVESANSLVSQGLKLLVAGEEGLLKQLNKGNWIGGTIPYFMSERGGVQTRGEIQVTVLPPEAKDLKILFYDEAAIHRIPEDYRSNGFSFVIIPAFSGVHHRFAKEGITWRGILDRPLVGWVSGIHLDDLGRVTPKVFNGQTGEVSDAAAVVMHLDLPREIYAKVNIINLFEQGHDDHISFPQTGFEVEDCLINDKNQNFADYLIDRKIDLKLPLVADYFGAKINVSVRSVDATKKVVHLYAPVFSHVEYRFAKPLRNYESQFRVRLDEQKIDPLFTCNCILNYLYAELEGKKTAHMQGPITFGEIAYMLLNQTLVYLTLEKKERGVDREPTPKI